MKNTYFTVFLVIELALTAIFIDKIYGFGFVEVGFIGLKAIGLVALYKYISN